MHCIAEEICILDVQPKHTMEKSEWTKLSPDERARATEQQMTDDANLAARLFGK